MDKKSKPLNIKNLFAIEDGIKREQLESLLVKNAPLGILMIDKNGVIVFENPYFAEKIIGVPKGGVSRALGMKIQEMPNVVMAGISGNIKKLLKGRKIKKLVFPFTSIYGKESFMSVDGVPLKDSRGKIIGSLLMISDVTEQNKAREALYQDREKLSITLKSIGDAVMVTDVKGRITFLNYVAQDLTKWPEEKAIGQPLCRVFNIFNEKTGKKVIDPAMKVMRSGKIVGLGNHTVLMGRDGKKLSIEDSAAPIKNSQGKVVGVVLIFRDVTKKRKLETELAVSEAKYRSLVEESPESITILDAGGNFVFLNKKSAARFSLPVERLMGKSVWDFIPVEDSAFTIRDLKDVLRNKKEKLLEGEVRIGKKQSYYKIVLTPIHSDGSDLVMVISSDISDIKLIQLKLQRTLRTIEVIGKCNEALVYITDEKKLLENICKNIVDFGYKMAWIGYARNDKNKSVEVVAGAGFEKGYLKNLKISWADNSHGRGPTGTAIRTGKAVVCSDILHDPKFKPWRAAAIKRGYASSISLPLYVNGLIGAINIYATEPYTFEGTEIKLLKQLADDLSYGIRSIRIREEKLRDQAALKQSERNYRELFEGSADAIFIADPVTKSIVDCNRSAEKLLGRPREEIRAMRVGDIHPKDLLDEAMKVFREQLSGKRENLSSEVLVRGGKRVPVSINASVIRINGKPYLQGIFRNIFKEKIAEYKLKESEERYRNLISNLPPTEYVLVYDENGKILWLSQTAENFLGYPHKKIIGSFIFDYIDPKYISLATEEMRGRLAGKKVKDYEIVVVNKSGKRLTVLVRGSNITYGGSAASLIILSDITEIVKKDEELEMKNIDLNKFKLAVDNAADNIIITDPDGVILYANSAVEKTSGYALNEIIGKTPAIWGRQMSKEFYEDFWKTIKLNKKSYLGEMTNKRKNGDSYIAEIKVAPILDDKNEIKFFVSTFRDITVAKELDRAKSEFVSVASHQLKTPVTGIKWLMESLFENKLKNLSEDQLVKMKEIYQSNERMIALINDLLSISRIDSGHYSDLNLARAEITPIIDRAVKNLSSFADQRGVKIICKNFLPDKYTLVIDEDKIYQTIANLISNSIKYSKDKGGETEIVAKAENGEFILSVKDNGIGIPLQNQRHIFEKFLHII
ncbi:MAG: PAS domain S-box protein, partial [Patescibacteria group bacterium]|nr:PAS domain S-box protein [Patescibacteria group bacterium]